MCDGVGLAAGEIVQLVGRVGVNEAIADPFGHCDTEEARDEQLWIQAYVQNNEHFTDLGNNIKCPLHAFVPNISTYFNTAGVSIMVKFDDIKRVA